MMAASRLRQSAAVTPALTYLTNAKPQRPRDTDAHAAAGAIADADDVEH